MLLDPAKLFQKTPTQNTGLPAKSVQQLPTLPGAPQLRQDQFYTIPSNTGQIPSQMGLMSPQQLFQRGQTPPPMTTPAQSRLLSATLQQGTVSQILSQMSQSIAPSATIKRPNPQPKVASSFQLSHLPSIRETQAKKQLLQGDLNEIIDTGRLDKQGRKVRLTRESALGLDKIYAIAESRGIRVKITSSYRSVEHQARLYEKALRKYGSEKKARKWVAPPGKSRHNSGKAIDLHLYRGNDKIKQSEFDEIIEKAGMYRPMSWEGWHIEPVSTKGERGRTQHSHNHHDHEHN